MSDLTVNVMGLAAVNKDLTVELRDPVTTRVVREVRPFLDGTVRVPNLEAGAYEMTIRHPNLVLPVLRRPIRVLPTGETKVSVLIDPSQFRNTPIEDIPEANLTPVRQLAESVSTTIAPLGTKRAGEAIKADDWNAMASAIGHLAQAVSELSRLVTPVGHDHVELIRKIDEMQGNFGQLLETLSAAMAELQRQIQTERFRRQVESVLDEAQVGRESDRGRELLGLVTDLEQAVVESPVTFGRKARTLGVQLETKLSQLVEERSASVPDLGTSAPVVGLTTTVELLQSQRTASYTAELEHNRKTDRAIGAGGLSTVLRGQR